MKRSATVLARAQLDQRLQGAHAARLNPPPPRGWIRAIRDALGMTSRQLAQRMGISQGAVAQLEKSETDGGIRLDSLRRAADALGCDLVYALVPRSSLDETVRERALELARADLGSIDQTMRLEDQDLGVAEVGARVADYADRLIAKGRLWDQPGVQ